MEKFIVVEKEQAEEISRKMSNPDNMKILPNV